MEVCDPSFSVSCTASPRVVIQSHNYKWNYKCRFQDEVQPRERNVCLGMDHLCVCMLALVYITHHRIFPPPQVDFSRLRHFKVLAHLPLVFDLSRFAICTDHPSRYDYYADTFQSGTRPALGVAGGRLTAEMKPLHAPLIPLHSRAVSHHDENVFESREMGIGLSLVEKEQKRFAEKKRAEVGGTSLDLQI